MKRGCGNEHFLHGIEVERNRTVNNQIRRLQRRAKAVLKPELTAVPDVFGICIKTTGRDSSNQSGRSRPAAKESGVQFQRKNLKIFMDASTFGPSAG
jgi:hypothetical protein